MPPNMLSANTHPKSYIALLLLCSVQCASDVKSGCHFVFILWLARLLQYIFFFSSRALFYFLPPSRLVHLKSLVGDTFILLLYAVICEKRHVFFYFFYFLLYNFSPRVVHTSVEFSMDEKRSYSFGNMMKRRSSFGHSKRSSSWGHIAKRCSLKRNERNRCKYNDLIMVYSMHVNVHEHFVKITLSLHKDMHMAIRKRWAYLIGRGCCNPPLPKFLASDIC